jgi:CRP-like cAMP-binding protein
MLSELSIESLRDRTLLLRSLPAFEPLEDDTLSLLAEHVRLRRHRAGEQLLTLGEPIHLVYIVLEGSVRWRRQGQREPLVAGLQDVVGWLTLMARDPHGMEAIVETDALTLEMPAEILEHILEEDFALIRNMLRMGATTLARTRDGLPVLPERAPPVDVGEPRARRRTLVERLIDMRNVPLFRRGNVEALIALTRHTQDYEVPAGHVFWQRGDLANGWVVIECGHVRCENGAGRSVEVGANFVVGIMDSIAQLPRSYSATALSPVAGHQIELEAFLGVLETHFDLARDFVAFMSRAVLDGD